MARGVVARPHEGEDAPALRPGDLRDDMRRRAEAVNSKIPRVFRHFQRTPADQSRAQQRRQRSRVRDLWQGKAEGGIGCDMRRIAAVARVACEDGMVAKIFAIAGAIGAAAASPAEPGNADPLAKRKAMRFRAHRLDHADDLMTRRDRRMDMGKFAVDDMQIRAADAAGENPQAQIARPKIGERPFFEDERPADAPQHHASGRHARQFSTLQSAPSLTNLQPPHQKHSAMTGAS